MSLGVNYSHTVAGGGAASDKVWPVCYTLKSYSNGYWELYNRFQGDTVGLGVGLTGGSYVGGSFLGGIYHGGREIQ